MVIGDMGSVRPGVPTLTVALRGMAMPTVEVGTLAGAKHSGQFGGAAPDALIVFLHALASLHDENGDVAVEGLRREEWTGEAYSDDEFRELAEVLPGLPLVGTGGLGSRVWSGPAITVTGIDVPSVENALNAVAPRRARASTCASTPSRTRARRRRRSSATSRRCGRSASRSRCARARPATGSRRTRRAPRTRLRGRDRRRRGAPRPSSPRPAARSRS